MVISNSNSLKLSGLYHILGNAHWAIGDVHKALNYQENSRVKLEQYLNSKCQDKTLFVEIRERQILSLFSTGLYKFDLWEIEDSDVFFSQVTDVAKEINFYRRMIKSSSFLSFTKAILGYRKEALILAEQAYQGIFSVEYGESGGFSFYLWAIGKAYRILGDFQKASEVYQKALSDVMYSGYTQGKAKVLSGIAEISREQAEFKVALLQHFEAIELLEEIGAKCDLAEARYQLGLTYQAMGEFEKSNENSQEAIRLFTEMQAPKQVDRVRRSMQNNI